MCLYPKLMRNKRYTEGGPIPSDERLLYTPIKCNNCKQCNKQKADAWRKRLIDELTINKTKAYFVLLTYSTESLLEIHSSINKELKGYNVDNAIYTLSVRRFLDRWTKKHGKSLRHWLINELGQQKTEHMHIHGIIWTEQPFDEVRKIWKYGLVFPSKDRVKENYVNQQSISYIMKYVTKIDPKHKYFKPVILTSYGMGNVNRISNYERLKDVYKDKDGIESQLPMYYRRKIYSDDQREQLWLKKLDEGVRYISGRKIPNWNTELINKLLKQEQKDSEADGFIGDKWNWIDSKHEQEQRELLRQARYKSKITRILVDSEGNKFALLKGKLLNYKNEKLC